MIKKNQFESQKGQNLPNMTEDEARMHIENLRWPSGPICPHCKSSNAYEMEGKSIRPGLKRCRDCRKQFTVTVGTIFEDSHLPLSLWIQAFHLICTSKKGSRREYACNGVTTNTAESYFALLKRGIHGVFHNVSRKHLHRYCTEFEFRWNGRKIQDLDRRDQALKQVENKLLRFSALVGN